MTLYRAIGILPPARPVLWPLRPVDSAEVEIDQLADGRRRISIHHAELRNVTPDMLEWWFGHVEGEMEYAGEIRPRYLVWHPLDHISYEVIDRSAREKVAKGTRLHLREAFQRNPENLLDIRVTVERLDKEEATIGRRILGLEVLRLTNTFEPTATGTRYKSVMVIGTGSWLGRFGVNRLLRLRILPGHKALAWVRHHLEEVGNLENFLPALYAENVAASSSHGHSPRDAAL